MKRVTLELTYPGGEVYRLNDPLEASLIRTLESPAQSLSATFPLGKGSLPGVAVGARLLRGGEEFHEAGQGSGFDFFHNLLLLKCSYFSSAVAAEKRIRPPECPTGGYVIIYF